MALIGEMQYLTIGGNTYSLPSGGGGSVSSVAVSNATNGGLSVSGSPITSSGTISIGHSNVLTSAQTTQAVYPIKIDKNGHISAYGSAVTITDEKLKTEVNDSDSSYPVLTSDSSTASTKNYSNLLYFSNVSGGKQLVIGGTASDSTKQIGSIKLFNSAGNWVSLQYNESGAHNRQLYLPDKSGTNVTLAVTSDIPSSAANSTTGISISNHSTSNIGSASGWSAGTASTWAFEEVSIPNVTAAGSASTWTFEEKTIPNVTAAGSGSFTSGTFSGGSGSFSATVTNHVLSFSHTHTAATHGADSHTHTAPTIGTAIKVQSKSGGGNGTAPTIGTAIKVQSKKSGSNSTVPSLTVTSTAVVTGTSHTITDNGHTHTLS